jgi:hypothetical protein
MKRNGTYLAIFLVLVGLSALACAPNSEKRTTTTIKPAEVLPGLSGQLVKVSRNVSRSFSAPYGATFRWQINDEQTVSASGYACRAGLIIDGDTSALNKAGEAIRKEGFASDQYNTSDTMLGYLKGRTVMQAVILGDPTTEPRCTLVIRIGTI